MTVTLPQSKLDALVSRLRTVEDDHAAGPDRDTYVKLSREFSELRPIVELIKAYHGAKVEIVSASEGGVGGYKEIIAEVKGRGAFAKLKFESGVHRVQRVPNTETQGRIHTSAATVAVLPEVAEVDVKINDGDLKIDTMRSGGAGGQHVNKTESAIRITHLPSGI